MLLRLKQIQQEKGISEVPNGNHVMIELVEVNEQYNLKYCSFDNIGKDIQGEE